MHHSRPGSWLVSVVFLKCIKREEMHGKQEGNKEEVLVNIQNCVRLVYFLASVFFWGLAL